MYTRVIGSHERDTRAVVIGINFCFCLWQSLRDLIFRNVEIPSHEMCEQSYIGRILYSPTVWLVYLFRFMRSSRFSAADDDENTSCMGHKNLNRTNRKQIFTSKIWILECRKCSNPYIYIYIYIDGIRHLHLTGPVFESSKRTFYIYYIQF